MTANLITPNELALWTQREVPAVLKDPFATEVMNKVSGLAKFLAGQPEWTYETAPFDAKMVVLMVAKRTYSNPGQVVQEGVGPLNERVLDVAALLTELTPSERATLTKYNDSGDPNSPGLWVYQTTRGSVELVEATLFVPDDSLSDWYIPMFSPLDPGDPNLYEDEVV